MQEKRHFPRYTSLARASVPKMFKGDALLRDISIVGCNIECMMSVNAVPEMSYAITIFPEEESHIDSFSITGILRWFHSSPDISVLGFFIKEPPKGERFKQYVDYLTYQSSMA